jgi:LPPG:FO 2-phospho-L-lactate transferase
VSDETREERRHVVALCGGVGGAKLAAGLLRTLPPEQLTVIVNTGDDFEHLGLSISPDIDTVVYTLSGLADPERGWGLAGETWGFIAAIERLGGETWFNLGDRDLATHVERTRRLRAGETLSRITADLAARLGIGCRVVPMSDDPVGTMLETPDGPLAFQHYFVRERCAPEVRRIWFKGAEAARPSPGLISALRRPDLKAVLICPSNPYLSIDPILAVPGIAATLRDLSVPRVAVCPIVGGQAIKGPTAKLMRELGVEPSPESIARHYRWLIDGLLIDRRDADSATDVEVLNIRCGVADTVMRSEADRDDVARATLALAEAIGFSVAAAARAAE